MSKGDYTKISKNLTINQSASKTSYLQIAITYSTGSKKILLIAIKPRDPFLFIVLGMIKMSKDIIIRNQFPKSTLNDSISDSILSPNGAPKKCDLNYYRTVKSGVQICVDKISQRTLHLTLVSEHPNYGSSFFHTRSGSASTLSKGGSSFICSGPNCGGPPPCDNAIFLLDISGSMNASMQFRQPPVSRIAAARDELIEVAKSCPDGSKMNVYTFNGGNRGSSFKPQLVALNDSIRRQLKTWLEHPNQRPWEETYPWRMMERAFRNPSVTRVHVISDGVTSKTGCFNGRCGMPQCYLNHK